MVSKVFRIKPLGNIVKTADVSTTSTAKSGISFTNLSNCHGKPLKQKKCCEECKAEINDKECTHKGIKVGKDIVAVPADAIKAKQELVEKELVIESVSDKLPSDAEMWYDEECIVRPVKESEQDCSALTTIGEGRYLYGRGYFGGRERQFVARTRDGVLYLRLLVNASQLKDVDVEAVVASNKTHAVSAAWATAAGKKLNDKLTDFDFRTFEPKDAEYVKQLISDAMDGKATAVAPKRGEKKLVDEIEQMNAA